MFSCKRWTSTKFVKSELTVETLASPKHGKITLKVHVLKRNVTPLFWVDLTFEWYERCHAIPRVYCYYFYLEPTIRKDTWMRTDSVTIMVMFFESGILKVIWSQLCSKSLLKNYEAHWQQYFERYPIVLYFTDMDQHAC